MKKTIQSGIDWLISDVSSAMPNDLKAVNRWKVLKAFQDGKEHTAMEVSVETGISRQTIMKAIRFFSDNGLLESGGKGDSTCIGGKKPEFFVLPTKKLCYAYPLRGKEFICLFLIWSSAIWAVRFLIFKQMKRWMTLFIRLEKERVRC